MGPTKKLSRLEEPGGEEKGEGVRELLVIFVDFHEINIAVGFECEEKKFGGRFVCAFGECQLNYFGEIIQRIFFSC